MIKGSIDRIREEFDPTPSRQWMESSPLAMCIGTNGSKLATTAFVGIVATLFFYGMSMSVQPDSAFAMRWLMWSALGGTGIGMTYVYLKCFKKKQDPALLTMTLTAFVLGTLGLLMSYYSAHYSLITNGALVGATLFGLVGSKYLTMVEYRDAKKSFARGLKALLKEKEPSYTTLRDLVVATRTYPSLLDRPIPIGPHESSTPLQMALCHGERNIMAATVLLSLGAKGDAQQIKECAADNPKALALLAHNGIEFSTAERSAITEKVKANPDYNTALAHLAQREKNYLTDLQTRVLALNERSDVALLEEEFRICPELISMQNESKATLWKEALRANNSYAMSFLMHVDSEAILSIAIHENDLITLDLLMKTGTNLTLEQISKLLLAMRKAKKDPYPTAQTQAEAAYAGHMAMMRKYSETNQKWYWIIAALMREEMGVEQLYDSIAKDFENITTKDLFQRNLTAAIIRSNGGFYERLFAANKDGKPFATTYLQELDPQKYQSLRFGGHHG